MRVLLAAYACAPGWGSEPGIGWGVASSLAADHDVWLLTSERYRGPFEDPANTVPPRLTVEFIPDAPMTAHAGSYAAYVVWQRAAFRRARILQEVVGFDVVQHVTFANCAMPSWLGRVGPPFLWYAGSFSTADARSWPGLGPRGAAAEVARTLILRGLGPLSRRLTLTANASVLAVDDPPAHMRRPWHRMVLGGLHHWERDALGRIALPAADPAAPLRVLSAGRLLGWKGLHLALRAFATLLAEEPGAQYVIVGDGEQRRRLERLAARLGIAHAVQFLGRCSREETFAELARCDVLLHPSLHEQVGFVVLEAMAAARPVVCLDIAGPPALVGETGLVVPRGTPAAMERGMAEALRRLRDDPPLRRQLGAAARQRVTEQWDWSRVAGDLAERYRAVVGS